ncbi:hypothetical protein [Phocaeicola coprocola]
MKSILLQAILMMAASENPNKVFDSLFPGNSKYNPDYKKKPVHRELKEFCIKGEKVKAYSRKDAIVRLKHKKQ